ncbi:hypothetical protein ESZ36_04770 [Colwellia demingiae]|uniref:Uncharacterized protein n=1 Tax=Colwellia demingiae TaxID=89401 RepID=A0A5C6QPZ8_9GAMM|nr:hypothetical protein [Colwellia demingiae]TWX70959.1 hypothetical protein ESZ36_04770 [Colwellia demingiae]
MKGLQVNRWAILLLALAGLTGCGGGGSDSDSTEVPKSNTPAPIDTSPEAFNFEHKTEQPLTTLITSNLVKVTGINSSSPISITGGEYSIDGGTFSNITSTVNDQQSVTVRLLSSASYSTSSDVIITIGDVSETFSVTTHSNLTKFAHELSTDHDARYSIVNQPTRGRVVVSPDLKKLTYQAMNSFDYLQEGETTQETIQVTLLGEEENNTYDLSFTITGLPNTSVCDDRTIIDLVPNEVNQPLPHIPEGSCVRVDASSLNNGSSWAIWTGENGGARPIMLSVIGVDKTDSTLTFLPPTDGRYSLSWCPVTGECLVSFQFYSDMPNTKKELNVALHVLSFHPEDEIYLSVTEKNHADTAGYTYRWVIHDWTGEHHKLVDILTTENKLKLPVSLDNNNYNIKVVVDDNIVQLEGGFSSVSNGLYGKIKLDANTIGNYETLSDFVAIRDLNSNQKAPSLVVMIDGDATRYQGNKDMPIVIKAIKDSQLTFDLSETSDENGDNLRYYINGALYENSSSRITFSVTSSTYYTICAIDGFPWTSEENPCLLFDVIAQ